MKKLLMAVLFAAVAARLPAQDVPEEGVFLPVLMEEISYAETLSLLELSPEQLEELLVLQMQWLQAATPDERIGLAFLDLRMLVIAGKTQEEAMAELDPLRPEMQQFQGRVEQARREGVDAVMALLDRKQLDRMALQRSPAQGLQNLVRVIGETRDAPAEQWQHMRGRMTNMLMGMAEREGAEGLTEGDIIATLDTLRTLPAEELKAKQAQFAEDLARKAAPRAMARLESPEARERMLRDVATRLLTFPKGPDIVRERLEAGAEMPAAE